MTPDEFRQARERLGLSARELADKLGVHPRTVQRWAGGSQRVPGPVVAALHAYLEAEPDSTQGGVHLVKP